MFGYNMGYPQYTPTYQQPRQPSGDDRIWVQGQSAAKAYLVAAGATVALWDSEQQRIYLKSVDANGYPSMQTLTYTIDTTASHSAGDNRLEQRVQAIEGELRCIKEAIANGHHADDTTV